MQEKALVDLLRLYHDASLVVSSLLTHCYVAKLILEDFTFVLQELNELLRNNKLELDDAGAVMVPEVNIQSYLPLYFHTQL